MYGLTDDIQALQEEIEELRTEREQIKLEVGLWLDEEQSALKCMWRIKELLKVK